jgi:NAD(P)-dependent dehydrogenase (short-subunit alcohol dehydrogenase family)
MQVTEFDLSGRAILVTGASQGLGLKAAERFAASGADIFLCARGLKRLSEAAKAIEKFKARPQQRILYTQADVSKPEDVLRLKDAVLKEFPSFQVLVSNAGVYGPKGKIEDVSLEEFREAVEINLFGPILLARAFAPHFRAQGYGKIIQLSGGGATSPMPRLQSYAASKAAVVRFMESLALDLQESKVDVNSISPGLLDTRLLEEILQAGPEKVGEGYYKRMLEAKNEGKCIDLGIPTGLLLFLASSASDGITGKLISAVWDDYTKWPEHIQELNKSDVYTLRRITGRDRGLSWGDK